MKFNDKGIINKIILIFLIILIYLTQFSTSILAATEGVIRKADSNTSNSYIQSLLGGGGSGSKANNVSGTRYAGRMWSDKTVTANENGEATFPLSMEIDGYTGEISSEEDFLHTFSVLGSTQAPSIEAASPLDVVITLDISTSMGELISSAQGTEDFNQSRIYLTCQAINSAIEYLMTEGNPENRVALIVYGGYESRVLPLGRYRDSQSNNDSPTYNIISAKKGEGWKGTTDNRNYLLDITATNSNNPNDKYEYKNLSYRSFTNFQSALYEAAQILGNPENNNLVVTNIDSKEMARIPVVMAMTDGASNTVNLNTGISDNNEWYYPIKTFVNTPGSSNTANSGFLNYNKSINNSNFYMVGNRGNLNSIENGAGVILTDLLTGALMKSWINKHYKQTIDTYKDSYPQSNVQFQEAQIYTIGVGITSTLLNQAEDSGWGIARLAAVLDPNYYFKDKPEPLIINGVNYSKELEELVKNGKDANDNTIEIPDNYTLNEYGFGYIWNSGYDNYEVDEKNPAKNGKINFVAKGQYQAPQLYSIIQAYNTWSTWSTNLEEEATIENFYKGYTSNANNDNNSSSNLGFSHLGSEFRPRILDYKENNYLGGYKENQFADITLSNDDIISNIYYVDHENFSPAETAEEILNVFTAPLQKLSNKFFVPISGNNANTSNIQNDSTFDYIDPIGEYMEVKSVDNVLLFGNLYNVNKKGTYDQSFNNLKEFQDNQEGWYLINEDNTILYGGKEIVPNIGSWENAEEAYKSNWIYRIDLSTAQSLIPSLISDDPEKIAQTSYTAYQIDLNLNGQLIDSIQWNPCYGNLPDVLTLEEEGAFDLQEIYLWDEDPQNYNSSKNTTIGNESGENFYIQIPSNAIPLQIASINQILTINENEGVGTNYYYNTNLGGDNPLSLIQDDYYKQSSPLRVFYSIGIENKILNSKNQIDLNLVSEQYKSTHNLLDTDSVYFLSNYYSETLASNVIDEESEAYKELNFFVGDPLTTFSPSEANRYYLFRDNRILYYIDSANENFSLQNPPPSLELGNSYKDNIIEGSLINPYQAELTYPSVTRIGENPGELNSESWYYIILEFYTFDVNNKFPNIPINKNYIAIARQGSEFGSGVAGNFGQYLCWYNPNTGKEIPLDPSIPSLEGSVIATSIGSLRTGNMINNIQYYNPISEDNGYYNITDTAEAYYFPIVYSSPDEGSSGTDVILNSYLGNNGRLIVNPTVPESTLISLKGLKTVDVNEGSFSIEENQFSFTLVPDQNNPLGDPITSSVTIPNGLPSGNTAPIQILNNVTYTQPGDYIYTLYEQSPSNSIPGISYSDAKYIITITVDNNLTASITSIIKDGNNLLVNGANPDSVIVFENSYNPNEISENLVGTKRLNGGTLTAGQFSFTITSSSNNPENDPLADITNGTYNPNTRTRTVTNNADGTITFLDNITFTSQNLGTYTYTIREVNGNDSKYQYDTNVYTVSYTVSNQNGTIATTRTIRNSQNQLIEGEVNLVFTNTYTSNTKKEIYPGNGIAVSPGQTITYTIDWSNNQSTSANVTIVDPLDSRLTFISASHSGQYYAGATVQNFFTSALNPTYNYSGVVVWNLGMQPANASGTVTLTAVVNNTAVTNGTIYNTAYENGVQTNTVYNPTVNSGSPHKTETTPGNGAIVADEETIIYKIDYQNSSTTTANINIIDPLDVGVTFVSATNGGIYNQNGKLPTNVKVSYTYNGTVNWTIPNVPAGGMGSVYVTVKVNEDTVINNIVYDQAFVQVGAGNWTPTEVMENPLIEDEEEPHKVEIDPGDGEYVQVGQTITYTISYVNNSNTRANVTIIDPLDIGVDFVSATNNGTYDVTAVLPAGVGPTSYDYNGLVTWTIPNVAAGSRGTVSLTVTVNENAYLNEILYNQAFVQVGNGSWIATEEPQNPLLDNLPHKAEVYPGEGISVTEGDEITYQIDYINNTDSTSTITIIDPLDTGLDFISASDEGSYDPEALLPEGITVNYSYKGLVIWTIPDVEPGGSGTVTLTTQVNGNAYEQEEIINQAFVQIDDGSWVATEEPENPLDMERPHKTEVSPGDGVTVIVGDQITYTIDYKNNSTSETTITIVDPLDVGVNFISASNNGTYSANNTLPSGEVVNYNYNGIVTWIIENVPAGYEGSVTLVVEVNENANNSGMVNNQAFVQIDDGSWVATEEPINPVASSRPHKVEITPGDNEIVNVGEQITYSITYENTLEEPATIIIVDPLDIGLDFVSASDNGSYNMNGVLPNNMTLDYNFNGTVTWIIPDVPAGGTGSVTLTVIPNESALTNEIVKNQAFVLITTNPEASGGNWIPTEEVSNPLIMPDVTIKKFQSVNGSVQTQDYISYLPGSNITYYLVVTNYTNVVANNVIITDTVPRGLSFIYSSVSNNGMFNTLTGLITWNIGTINPGESVTVSFSVQVPSNVNTLTYYKNIGYVTHNDETIASNEVTAGNTATNQTTSTTTSTGSPKTGVSSYTLFYIGAMIIGLSLIAYISYRRKLKL